MNNYTLKKFAVLEKKLKPSRKIREGKIFKRPFDNL